MRSDRLRSGKRPALTEKQRRFVTAFIETLDVEPAALQAGYSKRHAKAVGESLADILEGLERDILRILTRTLITEPLAAGIRGGLAGEGTGAGGLEGLFNRVFGPLGGLLGEGEPERPTITRVGSEVAEDATAALAGLGEAGGAAGALLSGTLADGALKAGLETLTQATASTFATSQLTELAVAAAAAAASLQTLVASSALPGATSGGGEALGSLAAIFGPGPHAAAGGGLISGPVHGPGGPTGDRIPALLSDGEFVVNAKAARLHRQILEAINSNRLVRHVEEGGVIGMPVPEIPPIRRGPASAPADSGAALRPIVNNFYGVTDHGSFQRNMPQFRGQLRELLSRAEKRDD